MSFDRSEHEYLKYRVRAAGLTFAILAEQLAVSPSMITRVSQGHTKSDKIMRGIADAIGVPPQEIWPTLYPIKDKEVHVES